MGDAENLLAAAEGFEWDAGNSDKNWRGHAVSLAAAEQTLLSKPLVASTDVKHSAAEPRFIALGRTDAGRPLTMVFTVRGKRVRVISARGMSRAERKIYAQAQATEADS